MARQPGNTNTPRWARYQIITAWLGGAIGVGLFVLQGVDRVLFGQDLDFGVLPWVLVALGVYVLFGLKLSSLIPRIDNTQDEGEGR